MATVVSAVDASGMHVDARDGHGFSVLWGAAQALFRGADAGLTDTAPAVLLEELLRRGASPRATFESGATCLPFIYLYINIF